MSDIKVNMKTMIRSKARILQILSQNETSKIEMIIFSELQRSMRDAFKSNLDIEDLNIMTYMYVENARILLCENGFNYFDKKYRIVLYLIATAKD